LGLTEGSDDDEAEGTGTSKRPKRGTTRNLGTTEVNSGKKKIE